METSTKTTVQIIQELISLQSAKLEKLATKKGSTEQQTIDNDPMIKKLMNELSQHGDASGSTIEKTDPYYDTEHHDEMQFKQAIDNTLKQASELPESLLEIIQTISDR